MQEPDRLFHPERGSHPSKPGRSQGCFPAHAHPTVLCCCTALLSQGSAGVQEHPAVSPRSMLPPTHTGQPTGCSQQGTGSHTQPLLTLHCSTACTSQTSPAGTCTAPTHRCSHSCAPTCTRGPTLSVFPPFSTIPCRWAHSGQCSQARVCVFQVPLRVTTKL